MSVATIIFLILFGLSFMASIFMYYYCMELDDYQSEADTKKQFVLGLLPYYWWIIHFKEWFEDFKIYWRELK
jgi:hypothetical protein